MNKAHIMTNRILNGKTIRSTISMEKKMNESAVGNFWVDVSLGNPQMISKEVYEDLKAGNVKKYIAPLVEDLKAELIGELKPYVKNISVTATFDLDEPDEDTIIWAGGEDDYEETGAAFISGCSVTFKVTGDIDIDEDMEEEIKDFFETDEVTIAGLYDYLSDDHCVLGGRNGGDYTEFYGDGDDTISGSYKWANEYNF